MKVRLGDICKKASSNIAQKDLESKSGIYSIYGASGFIKNVDFYNQESPYVAVVKDGAGIGRVMQLPAKSSVIGTMQYIIPNAGINVNYLAYAMEHMIWRNTTLEQQFHTFILKTTAKKRLMLIPKTSKSGLLILLTVSTT